MPLEDKHCTTLQGSSTSCGSRGRSGKGRVGEAPTRSAKLALWVNCPPSKAKSNSGWPPSQQSENPTVGEVPTQQSKFQHWVATQRAKEQEKSAGRKRRALEIPLEDEPRTTLQGRSTSASLVVEAGKREWVKRRPDQLSSHSG